MVDSNQPSEDKLTITSYNIENFSVTMYNETPEDKVTLIANSFIHEILKSGASLHFDQYKDSQYW